MEFRISTPSLPLLRGLEFLRNLFELITLDDVADLIFAKVAKFDSAFQAGAYFLYVILESPQGGESAIINRLTFPQDASASGAGDTPVCHETAGNDSLAQLEHLLHFGVTNDGLAMFRIEQPGHRFFDLIE